MEREISRGSGAQEVWGALGDYNLKASVAREGIVDRDKDLSGEARRRLTRRRLNVKRAHERRGDLGAVSQGVLGADSLGAPGHEFAQWLAERFNRNFDDYDRAIDAAYNSAHIGGSQFHHLLDGQHTVWGAFRAVEGVTSDDGFVRQAAEALEHLARDTMSVSGINPFFALSPEQFDSLGSLVAEIGVSKAFLADALTFNGPELLGGSVALVSAILMGRRADPERLSRFSGGCLLSASASANPVLLPIAAVSMVYSIAQADDWRPAVFQAGKGALISGAALLTSTLIGGPALLGCAAGFLTGVAVSYALDQPEAALERSRELVTSARQVMQQVAPSLRAFELPNG